MIRLLVKKQFKELFGSFGKKPDGTARSRGSRIAYIILFIVYYFDLDGKALYHFVEPNMDAHFTNMERPDLTATPYGPKEAVE